MEDPDFIAEMEDGDRDLSYASGEEVEQLAMSVFQISDEIAEVIVAAVEGEL